MIKDIVVNLSLLNSRDVAMDFAVSTAAIFNAHLAGIAFVYEPVIPMMIDRYGISAGMIESQLIENEKATKAAVGRFDEAARHSALLAEASMLDASVAAAPGLFAQIARRFDLSVLGQPEPDKPPLDKLLVEAALFETGRPVLVVPYIQKAGLKLDHVMLCWDGSRCQDHPRPSSVTEPKGDCCRRQYCVWSTNPCGARVMVPFACFACNANYVRTIRRSCRLSETPNFRPSNVHGLELPYRSWRPHHEATRLCIGYQRCVTFLAQRAILLNSGFSDRILATCKNRVSISCVRRDNLGERMRVILGSRWAWALAYAAFFLIASANDFGTPAWADSHRSDEANEPNQPALTGDWGGLRSYLEGVGITFTFNYVNDFLANARGGIGRGAVGLGNFQPQLDLDLKKLVGWEGGHLHIQGLVTHGPTFSPTYLDNILAVSSLEAGPVARLYSFWYQQEAFNGRLSIRGGLMSADSQFFQSKTASNFINNGFSWPTVLAANLPAGGSAYPLLAPGIRVWVHLTDTLKFQAAVFSGDPSGRNGSNESEPLPTGTVVSFRGGVFGIAEASYLTNQSKDAKGLPGTYRIGAWYHTSSHFADQRFDNTGLSLADPLSTGIPREHTGNSGIYGVVDQMLYRVPGTDDQGLSGFVRAGGGVPNDRNLINFYADGGLMYKGLIPRRPDDKIGIAAAYVRVGDNARGLDSDTGFFGNFFYPVRSGEGMVEMNYQAQLAPWWTLQPMVQYIIRPGGGVLNDDGSFRPNAWVIGLRSALKL